MMDVIPCGLEQNQPMVCAEGANFAIWQNETTVLRPISITNVSGRAEPCPIYVNVASLAWQRRGLRGHIAVRANLVVRHHRAY
jgi:hypothetical protein